MIRGTHHILTSGNLFQSLDLGASARAHVSVLDFIWAATVQFSWAFNPTICAAPGRLLK